LTSENNFFTKTKQLVKIWFCLFTLNVFRWQTWRQRFRIASQQAFS
jgi:hypothetical protein